MVIKSTRSDRSDRISDQIGHTIKYCYSKYRFLCLAKSRIY